MKVEERGERAAWGGSPDAAVSGSQAGAAGGCFLLGAGLFAMHWPHRE